MDLSPEETRFLTVLLREQNHAGCRGPAHDLLRQHAYPDVPLSGPGSIAFSYDTVPLTSLLLREFSDLQQIEDFLRKGEPVTGLRWPWSSALEYRERLEHARRQWALTPTETIGNGADVKPESASVSGRA
jgi:hypothetical protein